MSTLSGPSDMKQNLADQTCKLLKWLYNHRKLHIHNTAERERERERERESREQRAPESSFGNVSSCCWPNHNSDVAKRSSGGVKQSP